MEPTLAEKWEQFQGGFELFRDPLLCGLVAGCVLGFLSVYVVLRRMVFVSAAVSQAAGLGVALAFYAGIHLGFEVHPVLGAAGLSLLATLLLMVDPARLRLTRESVLGLAYALAGGAAVLVGDRIAQESHDINAILFGTAVVVRESDLTLVLAAGAGVMLLQLWWYRALTFTSFDRLGAAVQRLPVRLLDGALMTSVGVMVGVSARALGSLPVFAFSTLAAIAALVLELPLPATFAVATVLGGLSGVGGYVCSYLFEFPVGASQTVFASLLVLLALAVHGARGLVARAR